MPRVRRDKNRVLLVDASGRRICTVRYDNFANDRPFSFVTLLGEFQQSAQLPDGQWVYRWAAERGTRNLNRRISDYRTVTDPAVKGELLAPDVVVTWDALRAEFQRLIRSATSTPITVADLFLLLNLTDACINGVPYTPETYSHA